MLKKESIPWNYEKWMLEDERHCCSSCTTLLPSSSVLITTMGHYVKWTRLKLIPFFLHSAATARWSEEKYYHHVSLSLSCRIHLNHQCQLFCIRLLNTRRDSTKTKKREKVRREMNRGDKNEKITGFSPWEMSIVLKMTKHIFHGTKLKVELGRKRIMSLKFI